MSDKPKKISRLETLLCFSFLILLSACFFLLFKLQQAESTSVSAQFMVNELRARSTWFEPVAERLKRERDLERNLRAAMEQSCKLQDI